MKRYLVLVFGLAFAFTISAQTPLSLSWDGEPIDGNITVFGSQFDAEIVAHAVVTNNTDHSMEVKVRRNRIEMQDGTTSQFCWGLCFPPSTDESPISMTIAAGASSGDEDFSGHYIPNGVWGASIIEYEFFNMDNEEESVKMTVMFSATLSGIEDKEEHSFSMYPNPAFNQVTMETATDIQQLSIIDLTGKTVYKSAVGQPKVEVNIETLDKGIYLVRLQTEKGVVVKKLNVR